MHYLQCLSFASRNNFFELSPFFVIFGNFRLKNVFRKMKISQRRKKVSTKYRFLESLENFLSPLLSLFFPYFKASCRKIHLKVSKVFAKSRDVIMTSLWSHVPNFIHLITLFKAIPIDCSLDLVSILRYSRPK